MTTNDDIMLDHIFTLFCHVEDTVNEDVLDSVYFLGKMFDFDFSELPERLLNKVEMRLKEDSYDLGL